MRKFSNKTNIIFYFILSLMITVGVVFFAYRLWEIDINVPPLYEGDGPLGLCLATAVFEEGAIGNYFIDRLGAPGISTIIDTSFIDITALIEMCLIRPFVNSGAAIQHIFYYMTFPLCTMTMFFLLYKLTRKEYLACLFSVLFSINPYHFSRGIYHASLSNYYIVPLAIWIAVVICEEDFNGCMPQKYNRLQKMLLFLTCIWIGFSNIYYAFFGAGCMLIAITIKGINNRKISILWKEGCLLVITVLATVVSLLPNTIYHIIYGVNEYAIHRDPADTELYGLKLIQMILPCEYNNIPFLRSIYDYYINTSYIVNENRMSSLGLVATLGFFTACVWIIWSISRKNLKYVADDKGMFKSKTNSRVGLFSFIILCFVLYSIVGGIGEIFSYIISPIIRSVCRVSIFISCLCICIITLFLSEVMEKSLIKRYLIIAISIIALAFSIYSEVFFYNKNYQKDYREYDKLLSDFYSKLEGSLSSGDMVYTLPYIEFPEGGYCNYMTCYDPALCYAYTRDICWSYGAVKGRNDFASMLYIDDGMSNAFVDVIKDAGYKGIFIDRFGYNDMGDAIIDFYDNQLESEPIISQNGRFFFYNL